MKASIKRLALVVSTGVLSAAILAGCSEKDVNLVASALNGNTSSTTKKASDAQGNVMYGKITKITRNVKFKESQGLGDAANKAIGDKMDKNPLGGLVGAVVGNVIDEQTAKEVTGIQYTIRLDQQFGGDTITVIQKQDIGVKVKAAVRIIDDGKTRIVERKK